MRLQLLLASLFITLLVLVACSSMEPSSIEEAYGNQVPADFDWHEFDRLNPEIRLAQVPDYFSRINGEWSDKIMEEEGWQIWDVNRVKNSYKDSSLIWGANFNSNCLEDGNACCTGTDKIYADSIGISIKVARYYLKWSEGMICNLKSTTDLKEYMYKFLLYGRHGEEIRLIDSLMGLMDSTVFFKNYILSGRKSGLAYRACKPNELSVSRNSLVERTNEGRVCNDPQPPNSKVTCKSCVCDYSAYEFCADTTSNPHTLYVVQEKQ